MDQIGYECVEIFHACGPGAPCIWTVNTMGEFTMFADGLAGTRKSTDDHLILRYNVVEGVAYFSVDTLSVNGHARGEVTVANLDKYTQQLPVIRHARFSQVYPFLDVRLIFAFRFIGSAVRPCC